MASAATNNRLIMNDIGKSFNGVRVLDQVRFELMPGEIHALLGANGAGKSTLMKILSGAYTADEGRIEIGGTPVTLGSPLKAMEAGIQCVYQEVDMALVPRLTIAENVMLDRLSSDAASPWVSARSLEAEASRILAGIGFPLPVDRYAEEATIAQKQMILLARAVARRAKFIIFDEPTAPLSVEETTKLFTVMQGLKKEGVGSIFISHRLPEVFRISDRITVMRDGKVVLHSAASDTDQNEVVRAMLGKSFQEEYPKRTVAAGATMLEVRGLSDGRKVREISMSVRAGEIVGIAGLVGAGKTELSMLLFGADTAKHGEIRLHGRTLRLREPKDAVEAGIVLVPEERRRQGILVRESVMRNLTLAVLDRLSPGGFLNSRRERHQASALVTDLGIKTNGIYQETGSLSGGNQQKVAVGKWLPTGAEVYLFDEPTKGVDIGAKSDMFRLIGSLASEGKGIIYFSSELDEILGISDRILVMCDGRIVKEMTREEATEEAILYYASAGGVEGDSHERN